MFVLKQDKMLPALLGNTCYAATSQDSALSCKQNNNCTVMFVHLPTHKPTARHETQRTTKYDNSNYNYKLTFPALRMAKLKSREGHRRGGWTGWGSRTGTQ